MALFGYDTRLLSDTEADVVHVVPAGTGDTPDAVRGARRPVTVEDVPDVEQGGLPQKAWIEDYPGNAGRTEAAAGETSFERHDKARKAAGDSLWAPFEDEQEWQLAHWLVTSGLTQTDIETFLKLDIVSTGATVGKDA